MKNALKKFFKIKINLKIKKYFFKKHREESEVKPATAFSMKFLFFAFKMSSTKFCRLSFLFHASVILIFFFLSTET